MMKSLLVLVLLVASSVSVANEFVTPASTLSKEKMDCIYDSANDRWICKKVDEVGGEPPR